MAVLVRNTPAGMDTATYDKISAGLIPLIKKQPGFLMHVAMSRRRVLCRRGVGDPSAAPEMVRREREAQRAHRDQARGHRASQHRPAVGHRDRREGAEPAFGGRCQVSSPRSGVEALASVTRQATPTAQRVDNGEAGHSSASWAVN